MPRRSRPFGWGEGWGVVAGVTGAAARRLSYEWLAGLREIVIDSEHCPVTFAEFTPKEHMKDIEQYSHPQ